MPDPRQRRILPAFAVASVLIGILLATLDRFELPPPGVQLWEWCVMCGRQWGIDVVLNIVLFVPLGLVIRLVRVPAFPAVLAIAATTFVIEVLQLAIPGRITSVDDLIANVVGGIVGFVLGGHLRAIVAPAARQAVGAALAAGIAVFGVLWATLWLFEPAPTRHPYWGQFSPVLGQFAKFDGEVLEARVGDAPLRNGRLPNSDAVRALLRQDSVTVRAVARGGKATQRLAPVVSLFDGEHNEVMVLGRSGGRSLTFRLRSRASAVGLRTPTVSVWNAFPGAAAGASMPVRLSGTVHGYSITATAGDDGDRVSRAIHFRPTHGWAYFAPFEHLYTKHAARFTTIWLALIFSPLGYYSAIAAMRARGIVPRVAVAIWAATAVALGLAALPVVVGLRAGTADEWRGAALGVALGVLAAAVVMATLRSRDGVRGAYN